MPRQPKLRTKNSYWYTGAGQGKYFGRTDSVSHGQARQLFHEYLKSLSVGWSAIDGSITVAGLAQEFLNWVRKFRSDRTLDERKRHLECFCNFRVGGNRLGELRATDVKASDLEEFLNFLKTGNDSRAPVEAFTADKYATSVKASYNWGAKHPSPTPLLPAGFQPFASIEKYKRSTEAVMEADLLSLDEIDLLIRLADTDLGAIRTKRENGSQLPEKGFQENPYVGFADLLRVYHSTGARTSELASAVVGDYSPASRQIVLRKHKRSHTLRDASARRITVNDEVAAIIKRHAAGKDRHQPIFTDPKGRSWTRHTLDHRFQQVRERADVRSEITIYSFRHLWISEALMSGVDVATVSRMAGTSIAMIEKVYGHFRSDHLREAQSRLDAARQQRRADASTKDSAA